MTLAWQLVQAWDSSSSFRLRRHIENSLSAFDWRGLTSWKWRFIGIGGPTTGGVRAACGVDPQTVLSGTTSDLMSQLAASDPSSCSDAWEDIAVAAQSRAHNNVVRLARDGFYPYGEPDLQLLTALASAGSTHPAVSEGDRHVAGTALADALDGANGIVWSSQTMAEFLPALGPSPDPPAPLLDRLRMIVMTGGSIPDEVVETGLSRVYTVNALKELGVTRVRNELEKPSKESVEDVAYEVLAGLRDPRSPDVHRALSALSRSRDLHTMSLAAAVAARAGLCSSVNRHELLQASHGAQANYGYAGLDRMLTVSGLKSCGLVNGPAPEDLMLIRRSLHRERQTEGDVVAVWRALEMSCFLNPDFSGRLVQEAREIADDHLRRFDSLARFPDPATTDELYATLRTAHLVSAGCSAPWWQTAVPEGGAS